jgi:hypothetical protein
MKFTFTTGREYADAPQRISVEYNHIGQVAFFNDHTRYIRGYANIGQQCNEHDVRDAVMKAYDTGAYTPA